MYPYIYHISSSLCYMLLFSFIFLIKVKGILCFFSLCVNGKKARYMGRAGSKCECINGMMNLVEKYMN